MPDHPSGAAQREPPRGSERGVSVVVATARPDEMMDVCALAIARAAARLAEPAELIIVDDRDIPQPERRSSEEALGGLIVRRFWSSDLGARGQSAARNLGVSFARYDILALTDDDTRPDERWLELGVGRLRSEPSLAGVEGAIRVDTEEPFDAVRSRLVLNLHGGACINASMFYRASAYRAVGGSQLVWLWPPVNYREDSDLAHRILRDAGPIAFEPGAFVIHPAEAMNIRRLCWVARCFMADAMLIRLHPEVFPSVWRRPLVRLRIRCATLTVLIVPALAGRHTRRLAAAFVAAAALVISAQFEAEIRAAGIRRSPFEMGRDTLRRWPRSLLWLLVAGFSRLQGTAMVALNLVALPPLDSTGSRSAMNTASEEAEQIPIAEG